jgi:hypothetical protein
LPPTPLPTPDPEALCTAFSVCEQCVDVVFHPTRPNCRFCGSGCQDGGSCSSNPNIGPNGACPTPLSTLTTQTQTSTASTSSSLDSTMSNAVMVDTVVTPSSVSDLAWIIPVALVGAICLIGALVGIVMWSKKRKSSSANNPANNPETTELRSRSDYGRLPPKTQPDYKDLELKPPGTEYSDARVLADENKSTTNYAMFPDDNSSE